MAGSQYMHPQMRFMVPGGRTQGQPQTVLAILCRARQLQENLQVRQEDNKDNVVVNHISFTLPMMTASFSDLIYTVNMKLLRYEHSASGFNSAPWGAGVRWCQRPYVLSAPSNDGLLVGTSNWPHSITGRRDNAPSNCASSRPMKHSIQ